MSELSFRFAEKKDCGRILSFIRKLSVYEKMENEVTATEELLEKQLFADRRAEVLFICEDGREIGFALFFHNFSTFVGKAGLYLEDFYIEPPFRGKGYGRATMRKLCQIARERDCGRVEWSCLDWNTKSIDFYLSLGARAMDEWTVYRLDEEAINRVADGCSETMGIDPKA